jgi:hypothetical protein
MGSRLWITFIDKEGEEHKLAVNKGDNLLDVAQAHDLEMEGKFLHALPPESSFLVSWGLSLTLPFY